MNNISLEKKITQSLHFLEQLGINGDLHLGFSGGKDSVVIYDLAKRAGIDFKSAHAITTRDAPGSLEFIRKNFSDVELLLPKTTYGTLVQQPIGRA